MLPQNLHLLCIFALMLPFTFSRLSLTFYGVLALKCPLGLVCLAFFVT